MALQNEGGRRLTTDDFPPEVLSLFDKYVHGIIDRREFLEGASRFAVGGMTALAMLEALKPQYAFAQQVPPQDARIRAEYVNYPSPGGTAETIKGLFARPANLAGRAPAVLVVHENRGLNPYIEDVARRFALAGFIAIAPDGLSSLGGYPGTDEKGVEMQRTLDAAKLRQDFVNAANYLRTHASSTGRVGAVGFCYGGGVVNFLAQNLGANLGAGAPFYGGQGDLAAVPRIQAPLQLHYAENDERINAGIAAYEAALKAAGKKVEVHIYPGTSHGFHNDTTPRYTEAAAKLAQERTIAWFRQHLGASATQGASDQAAD